jgi:hypothetical protein
MEVSDASRLKSLEDRNGKLKRLLTDTMLDNAVLKDLPGRRWRHPNNGGGRRSRRCGIIRSRSAGPAAWLVSILKRCGANACLIMHRSAE